MFFSKKKKSVELITLNQEKLMSDMQKIGDRLNEYKDDQAMKDVRALIYIGKNLAILNCATAKNDQERIFMQSKVESFSDIQNFIDISIERKAQDQKEGRKAVKGTFNAFRRVNNQAGSAF